MVKEDKDRLAVVLESMTDKQRLFLTVYHSNGFKGADAVRKAGYETAHPDKMFSQILNNKKVKEAHLLMQKQMVDKISISPDYVVRKLVQTVEKAEQEGNHNATLRGLELIAKHLGMFIDRTEITGKDGAAIQMEQKVKEDVAAFISSLSRLAKRGGEGEAAINTLN
jgi:hypothetical protein